MVKSFWSLEKPHRWQGSALLRVSLKWSHTFANAFQKEQLIPLHLLSFKDFPSKKLLLPSVTSSSEIALSWKLSSFCRYKGCAIKKCNNGSCGKNQPVCPSVNSSVFFALLSVIGCVKEKRTKRGGVVCLDTEILYMFNASGNQADSISAFHCLSHWSIWCFVQHNTPTPQPWQNKQR